MISASCPACTKPISLFETIASISSRLSLRNDDGEHLRRHHHAADRVHAELLHHAVDRRREELQLGPALGLDDVPAERGNLLIGLGEIVEQSAAALGRDPVARLLQRRRGCIDLAHLAALDDEVLLHSDEVLVFGEVGQLGAELLPVEIFAQIDPLLQHRYGRLELPITATTLARSASFFACSRSISASLPLSSALWAMRNCRCISVCAQLAPGGASMSFFPTSAAGSLEASSSAATRSLLRCPSWAPAMVGSSSIRTSPALTLCPLRTWIARHAGLEEIGSAWCGRSG